MDSTKRAQIKKNIQERASNIRTMSDVIYYGLSDPAAKEMVGEMCDKIELEIGKIRTSLLHLK